MATVRHPLPGGLPRALTGCHHWITFLTLTLLLDVRAHPTLRTAPKLRRCPTPGAIRSMSRVNFLGVSTGISGPLGCSRASWVTTGDNELRHKVAKEGGSGTGRREPLPQAVVAPQVPLAEAPSSVGSAGSSGPLSASQPQGSVHTWGATGSCTALAVCVSG